MKKYWKPILMLLLLSPAIPELTTGSTPLYRFLNPLVFIMLMISYGVPAIIYRELMVALNYDYKQLLLLGLVQGVYVEGILVNTYYNPETDKNGIFGYYGRFMGINWPWAAYLTIFHSIYSVLVPIMITHSLFPNIKGERLTSNNGLKLLILLALVNALIFNLSPETYKPPEQYHIFSLILIALFIIAADKLGRLDVRLAKLCSSKILLSYPVILVIILFYATSRILHPLLHIILGILSYMFLLGVINGCNIRNSSLEWVVSSRLLLGMNITGIITGLLNPSLRHVIVPNTVFIIFLVTLQAIRRRSSAVDKRLVA